MNYLTYGNDEIIYLKEKDAKLGEAIESIGMIQSMINPNIFEALVDTIVGQQISSVAATTVFSRLKSIVGEITPISIYNISQEDIQKCGMSFKKAGYIKDAASSVIAGTPSINKNINTFEGLPAINIDSINILSDEDVIKTLSTMRGIGKWTAQMLLIFSLGRMDVISYDDLAIRRGMKILYNLDKLTLKDFKTYSQNYSPYSTVASLYLWKLSSERIKYASRTFG